ncbi:MAG TPA: hypothetical protein VEC96_11000, partial [Anaerolineae bacterium]|nr:hypothetical protein [Anaerolineae bacterium]
MKKDAVKSFSLSEDKYKGLIFTYFVGAVWVVAVINALQNFYLSLTLADSEFAQEYASYNVSNVGYLIFFGLIWAGHRWHPRLMRHIFIFTLVVGAIFSFSLRDLNVLFVTLTLPIIMAAFLIRPIYSFVYYGFIIGFYVL